MQRLWLRWLVLALFCVVVVVAFVTLGRWQLSRLEERRAENAQVAAQRQAPPVGVDEALGDEVTDAEQWRRVELTGEFDSEHQVHVRNRRNGEARGFEVLTPLRLADGRSVWVSRGFVADTRGIPETLPAPPAGEVDVLGWLRRNEQGREALTTPSRGSVRLVSTPALASTVPYPVLTTGWVAAADTTPVDPQPGYAALDPVQPPAPTEGNHLSYALQWFAFTAIAVGGVVVLVRGDLRERRRERAGAPD
ncbi:SURF1 family cytochrome oxidase biogenesis protein [Desertihabitans aurantiacus]|uniref:SURF1 family cytochrome oxidase biogenesis protein n=1 Tax=Desertihabitans aurantiacus TaxID=2282477 RepID=UPI001300667F|nr:SURF1 family protein [Desertihabitans aurantiacus]